MRVQSMLRKNNCEHLISANGVTSVKDNLRSLKKILREKDHEVWHKTLWNDSRNLENGNKLRIYRVHKSHCTTPEHYLKMPMSRYDRSHIARLRSGTLPLRVETGRYINLPLPERRCFCDQQVEDEVHFLIDCHIHDAIRQELLVKCQSNIPDFMNLPSLAKYSVIMNTPMVQRLLARTVNKMMAHRRTLL